jgi:4,5:9,10-diseco-3-hydroxy-5,9,17-trioxoandrosta-1(10),2-diene-4-oate hydrolase
MTCPPNSHDWSNDVALTKEETDRFVTVNGIKLHYNEAGTGPALICTHGGGPGANAWDNSKSVFDELSKTFRVILLDMPGWGESQKLVKRGDVPLDIYLAKLLLDFMDELGIDQAHQYGSSQFAPACLRFGIEYPDRIGKIVVQSSEFGPQEPGAPRPGIQSLINFAQNPTRENIQTMFEYFTPREEFRPASVIDNRFEKALAPDHLASRREFPNAANSDLTDVLPKLQAEVLYVCGNDDGMIPVTTALDALKMIPQSRAVIWGDRSGHFVITEHAAEYARIVTDFLTH